MAGQNPNPFGHHPNPGAIPHVVPAGNPSKKKICTYRHVDSDQWVNAHDVCCPVYMLIDSNGPDFMRAHLRGKPLNLARNHVTAQRNFRKFTPIVAAQVPNALQQYSITPFTNPLPLIHPQSVGILDAIDDTLSFALNLNGAVVDPIVEYEVCYRIC